MQFSHYLATHINCSQKYWKYNTEIWNVLQLQVLNKGVAERGSRTKGWGGRGLAEG
jgi:hypothetical protein